MFGRGREGGRNGGYDFNESIAYDFVKLMML